MRTLPLVGLAGLLLATGCGPRLGIMRTRPAQVNLSPARDVSVEVQARPISPAEALMAPVKTAGMVAATGSLDGELRERLTRRESKFRVVPPGAAQCRLGMTVTDWTQDVVDQQSSSNSSGMHGASPANPNAPQPPPKRQVRASLRATLNATCAHRGQAVLTQEFYSSDTAELSPSASLELLQARTLEHVTEQMAHNVSYAITPPEYADYVALDDSEKALEPMVRRIQDGQLAAARTELEGYLATHAQSAAAVYNLGVLDEAEGNLDGARARYAQANGLKAKDMYAEGIERVARVVAEQAALAGQ